MKVRDCLSLAALFLNDADVEAALNGGAGSGDTARDIEQLLRCANLVIHEIAAEYMPLFTRERIWVQGGAFELKNLQKRCLHLYHVEQNGDKKSYICRYGVLTAADGEYEVVYSYVPDTLKIDAPLPFDERISARLIGYGVAAEYAMISGLEQEAVLFDKRYKDALFAAAVQRTEKKVKKRRWL